MIQMGDYRDQANTRLSARMTMEASYVGDEEYDRSLGELIDELPSRQQTGFYTSYIINATFSQSIFAYFSYSECNLSNYIKLD